MFGGGPMPVQGGFSRGGAVGPEPRAGGFGSPMQTFKKGGKVKRTGLAHVDKGEKVLTKKQQKAKGMK